MSARMDCVSRPSVLTIVTDGRATRYPPFTLIPVRRFTSYQSVNSGFTTNVFVASLRQQDDERACQAAAGGHLGD